MGESLFEAYALIAMVVFAALDAWARLAYWEPAYAIGPVVLRTSLSDAPRPVIALGTVLGSQHGAFKLVSPDRVLARERFSLFDRHQLGVMVTIDWSSGEARATGRLPLGVVVGLAVFVLLGLLWNVEWSSTVLGFVVLAVLGGSYAFMSRSRSERLIREYLDVSTHA